MRTIFFLSLSAFVLRTYADNVSSLCESSEGSSSCGQCIKQHPSCAWCRDPHAKVASRCMQKSLFTADKCNPNYVYSPVTELKISPSNMPLESIRNGQQTPILMEPQQVVLRMKPGDTLTVPFKYLHKKPAGGYDRRARYRRGHHRHHKRVKEFAIQTSEFNSMGVDIEFVIDCEGKEIVGRQCPKLTEGQLVTFKAKVTLQECKSSGDIAISVGVYGYRAVSAIFVTPLCGCECEKLQQQEKNSPLCYQHGNLICGQCQCQNGRGGENCECPLALYAVNTAEELTDKCREIPGGPVCGGAGKCKCGKCQCDDPTVTGNFCSCNHKTCPLGIFNNQTCSGNGVCECGKCVCEDGWDREDCSCTKSTDTCMDDGKECSDNGHCECGKCVCDTGFTGATCNAKEDDQEEPTVVEEESTPEIPMTQPEAEGIASEEEETTTTGSEEESESSEAVELQQSLASATSLSAVLVLMSFNFIL